jgi:protease II
MGIEQQDPSNKVSNTSQQGNKWTIFQGKAVEDKVPDSRDLKIQLDEQMPFMEGELGKIENEVSTASGSSVKTTNYVTAQWMGLLTNRTFPPDVRRGEQILVFNYGDSDKYFWFSFGRDDSMRTVERLRFNVADEKKTVKTLTDENTYYIEMDTLHKKHIIIKTCKSDKEEYAYILKFDAQQNTISLCDDGNNEIYLESDVPRWFIRNRDGSYVDVNKKNVILFAPEDIVLKAGRQIVEDSPMKTNREKK